MYTQCPACKTAYRITTDEVRLGQGIVLCSHCNSEFDSVRSLAEVAFEYHFTDRYSVPTLRIERAILPESEEGGFDQPAHSGPGRMRWGWGFAALLMVVVLFAQIIIYQTPGWAQNQKIRPWLKGFCDKIDCRLPKYHHPEDIEVIERTLEPAGHDALKFRLVIVNNGSLPVALPGMYLELIRFNGEPLAQRIFAPHEYFDVADSMSDLPVGKPIELSLKIANPDKKIAGYSFKFI